MIMKIIKVNIKKYVHLLYEYKIRILEILISLYRQIIESVFLLVDERFVNY